MNSCLQKSFTTTYLGFKSHRYNFVKKIISQHIKTPHLLLYKKETTTSASFHQPSQTTTIHSFNAILNTYINMSSGPSSSASSFNNVLSEKDINADIMASNASGQDDGAKGLEYHRQVLANKMAAGK